MPIGYCKNKIIYEKIFPMALTSQDKIFCRNKQPQI